MNKVTYEECEIIWRRKRVKDLIGEINNVRYACKKLGVVIGKHPEITEHYRRYIKNKYGN